MSNSDSANHSSGRIGSIEASAPSISSIEVNEIITTLGIISKKLEAAKVKPWDAFFLMDKDRSRDLSVHEFAECIATLKENNKRKLLSMKQAEKLVRFLDVNRDGTVDFREFVTAIQLYRRHQKKGTLHLWEGAYTHSPIHTEAEHIFPDWLKEDSDFRTIFTRYNSADYREMKEKEKLQYGMETSPPNTHESARSAFNEDEAKDQLWKSVDIAKHGTENRDDIVLLELSCSKVFHMRTSEDMNRIAKWLRTALLSRLVMQEDFNLHQLAMLCRNVEILKKTAGQSVLQESEPFSCCCYIIIKGKVRLLSGEQGRGIQTLQDEDCFGGHSVLQLLEKSRSTNLEHFQNDQQTSKSITAVAGNGGASVLLIHFEVVKRWLMKLRETQRHTAVKTIQKSLKHLSPSKLRFLASYCVFDNFPPGSNIFKEGDKGDKVYFVVRGTIHLSRQVQLVDGNQWPIGKDAVENVVHHKSLHLQLATISHAGWFGEEFMHQKPQRMYSAAAGNDEAETFYLDSSVTKRVFRKENPFQRPDLEKLYRPSEDILREYKTRRQAEKNYETLKLSALGDSYLRRKVGNTAQSTTEHISTTNGKRPWAANLQDITKDWTTALRDDTNLLGIAASPLRSPRYEEAKDTFSIASAKPFEVAPLNGGTSRPALRKLNSWSCDRPPGLSMVNTKGEEVKFPSCLPALMCHDPTDRKMSSMKVKGADLLLVAESSEILGVLESKRHTESTIILTSRAKEEKKKAKSLERLNLSRSSRPNSDITGRSQMRNRLVHLKKKENNKQKRESLAKMKEWQSTIDVSAPEMKSPVLKSL
eukprot:CAMPEP_0117748694 /NCGR_PEP_ID=MMETSP0947-20121206/9294_1 /TAXON_ID=44440 /ORGANISM="Chattonella subsalsa, Strain CCMP2191" /LENGTH=813 /DNA_ID=CAMNT_0005566457 /DNA_START=84 /DNA_END=2526 /DNA_ORIENTATION=+